MTREEILMQRMENQHLLHPAPKIRVVRDLCGLQAQIFANVVHSLQIRCSDYAPDTFSDGLVRNWSIRGTMHVFLEEDLPLFLACHDGTAYRQNEWTGKTFWNQRDCWALTPERQKYLSEVVLRELENGVRTREELKDACRNAGMGDSEKESMFDPWGGGIRDLCVRGFMHATASEEKAYCLSPVFDSIPIEEAELLLARRYFTHFAPATIHDAMYFFHTTAAKVKRWLSQLPVVSHDCDGRTYYSIPANETSALFMPDCLFLAGFDQFMLGYEKKESLCLWQENLRGIFNLAGIVMPPLLLQGEVAGRWKRRGKTLTLEMFRPVTEADKNRIRDCAEQLWSELTSIRFVD